MIAIVHDVWPLFDGDPALWVKVEWEGGDGWAYWYRRTGKFADAEICDRIAIDRDLL